MQINSLDLFLTQRRFDLIFKFLYAKDPSNYVKDAYLESISAFNGFSEESTNGILKSNPSDFLTIFDTLINEIKEHGFDSRLGLLPIGTNGDIIDGAHRLAICAAYRINVVTETSHLNALWDYHFFRDNGLRSDIMDFGALEYVKINPNAYIVNLQPVTNSNKDNKVVEILEKYGFVYYEKKCWVTFNGLVNLKKICYGSSWEKASWIGSVSDGFYGAKDHASHSMGKNPMRVFIFVCPNINNVKKAKEEIRALYGIGNYSVHINDTHEEAICLAENYFNSNTLFQLNTRPYQFHDKIFENHIEYLKLECQKNDVSTDRICGAGSTPLNVFHIRHSQDLDYITIDEKRLPENEIISSHNRYQENYPYSIQEIVTNPIFHMYYNGIKFISLDVLYEMKNKRHEIPKDILDCRKLKHIIFYKKIFNKRVQSKICKHGRTKIQGKLVALLYKYNERFGNKSLKLLSKPTKLSPRERWRKLKRKSPLIQKAVRIWHSIG